MRAWQKFDKRLEELELLGEWNNQGGFGRIATATPEGIIILVHEARGDAYNEYHYPPLEVLSERPEFRGKALANFEEDENPEFVGRLYQWAKLNIGKCPLMPEDVFFIAEPVTEIEFADD